MAPVRSCLYAPFGESPPARRQCRPADRSRSPRRNLAILDVARRDFRISAAVSPCNRIMAGPSGKAYAGPVRPAAADGARHRVTAAATQHFEQRSERFAPDDVDDDIDRFPTKLLDQVGLSCEHSLGADGLNSADLAGFAIAMTRAPRLRASWMAPSRHLQTRRSRAPFRRRSRPRARACFQPRNRHKETTRVPHRSARCLSHERWRRARQRTRQKHRRDPRLGNRVCWRSVATSQYGIDQHALPDARRVNLHAHTDDAPARIGALDARKHKGRPGPAAVIPGRIAIQRNGTRRARYRSRIPANARVDVGVVDARRRPRGPAPRRLPAPALARRRVVRVARSHRVHATARPPSCAESPGRCSSHSHCSRR